MPFLYRRDRLPILDPALVLGPHRRVHGVCVCVDIPTIAAPLLTPLRIAPANKGSPIEQPTSVPSKWAGDSPQLTANPDIETIF